METKQFIILLLVSADLADITALPASSGEVNDEIPAKTNSYQ